MTAQQVSEYGQLIEPGAVRMERELPGPIDRIWRYLTDSELRRTWLAAGDMDLREGGHVDLVFRIAELTTDDDRAPEQHAEDHHAPGVVLACDPPHLLSFTWHNESEVTFTLTPVGDRVLLELVHRKVTDRPTLVGVSSGWHHHLDLLVGQLTGTTPGAFWPEHARLEAAYGARIPE